MQVSRGERTRLITAPVNSSVAWFEFGTDKAEMIQKFYGELFD
ncbi:hypothetical protein [Nocardia fluminea]